MNQQKKKEWVVALRSGEYQQGHYFLKMRDENNGVWFCCLGVLCDLKDSTAWKELIQGYEESTVKYEFKSQGGSWKGVLPPQVVSWAGLLENGATVEVPTEEIIKIINLLSEPAKILINSENYNTTISLTTLNDSGATFEDIALIIESCL